MHRLDEFTAGNNIGARTLASQSGDHADIATGFHRISN